MLALDAPAAAVRIQAGVRVRPYTPDLVPAVRGFNQRLAARGIRYRFPETHLSDWLPALPDRSVRQEYFLAVDRTDTVRGAYILKHQRFQVGGDCLPVGFYHLPLSEGLIDSRYALLGVQLLADALKRQPDLFVLGIGGFEESLARMVQSLGWPLRAVPFYFKVLRPFRFARQVRHLRNTAPRRLLLDTAAFSGAAWVGTRCLQLRPPRSASVASSEIVDRFEPWTDDVWERVRARHVFAAVRDAATLNVLYRADARRFIRIEVTTAGRTVGWAVVLNTQMRDHRHFGNLRVGSIVDCLADPGSERAVAKEALRVLRHLDVDVIVSNQSARSWGEALRQVGFLAGPSGFLFGASRSLARRLGSFERTFPLMHLTRGDGDGPISL